MKRHLKDGKDATMITLKGTKHLVSFSGRAREKKSRSISSMLGRLSSMRSQITSRLCTIKMESLVSLFDQLGSDRYTIRMIVFIAILLAIHIILSVAKI